ncbi:MAG: ATP-dependent Clp protease proteolytic subunit [Candidatus Omnitrophica bacterium]|nr:ATP-dependent Clp protease proteolytic subunit [Candidatus Omnitrophota bacterium]
MNKNIVIKFFAPVMDASINALMNAIDQKMQQGVSRFTILISSPGGSVFHGLSAYNYLKGIPAEIVAHNFGSVDSIGIVLYCAAKRRLCVPQSRFLLHGVTVAFRQNENLEEKQLEERLKGLRIDIENIAGIISSNTRKTKQDVINAMLERTTLNPEQAKEWGLVHEIKSELYPFDSEVISIHFQQQQTQPLRQIQP